jgi:cob(I)alamin adenosyltransferase
VRPEQAQRLEAVIDRLNERLGPLRSFVLPGGSAAAAWCHLARTVCRRAERDTVTLARTEPINPQVTIYLNRLSDLLFVLARVANHDGRDDVLWVPGKTQSEASPASPG